MKIAIRSGARPNRISIKNTKAKSFFQSHGGRHTVNRNSIMPSVIASEDHPMDDAPDGEDNTGAEAEEAFIDIDSNRIRVVCEFNLD